MTIRPLSPADRDKYRTLFLRGLHDHPYQFRITAADVEDAPTPMESAGANDFTLGAFDNDGLIGIVSVTREVRVRMRHKALLHKMYVSAGAAGQGIGRGLLRATIKGCEEIPGLEQIILTVVGNNERAQALYTSEGFVAFAHEPRALCYDTGYVDEIQMVRFLHNEKADL